MHLLLCLDKIGAGAFITSLISLLSWIPFSEFIYPLSGKNMKFRSFVSETKSATLAEASIKTYVKSQYYISTTIENIFF